MTGNSHPNTEQSWVVPTSRRFGRLENLLNGISATSIVVLMLFAVVQVVGRKVFNAPIFGYIDWVEQIMVLFSGEKYSPKPLDDHEKVLVSNLQGKPLRHPDMPRAIAFEYPVWMDQLLSGLWGSLFE